jgi:hypothetical protein
VFARGKTLNIACVKEDPRYDSDVDGVPDKPVFAMLCLPIIRAHAVVGVLQLINKRGAYKGKFSKNDEHQIETMANIIGISLHNLQQQEILKKTENQSKIAFEMIQYYTHFKSDELICISQPLSPQLLASLSRHDWDYRVLTDIKMCSCVLYMFERLHFLERFIMQPETLKRFILTVRNSYRDVPYHNWSHAFCVTQCLYTIVLLSNLIDFLEEREILALLVSCLGHDLDHRGKNNAFLKTRDSDLKQLYGDKSILEHHHYNILEKLLSNPNLDIFENCDEETVAGLKRLIKFNILATDLAGYSSHTSLTYKVLGSSTPAS